MDENRRDGQDRDNSRVASDAREDQGTRKQQDDLARRRDQQRQAHLTNREREDRWPIG